MSSNSLRWAALLLCCMTATAASREQEPTIQTDRDLGFFTDSRAATLALVKRVGMLPMQAPAGFENREDVAPVLQKAVTEYLQKAGLEVIGPEAYAASYDRLNQQLGGIYSPLTGDIRPEQYRAVVDNAHREYIEGQKLDGYVIVRIVARSAKFYGNTVDWDGAKDSSVGRLPANALAAFFSINEASGTLPGYSVVVQISNTQDKIVFGRRGGLQPGAYYDTAKSKGVSGFRSVPKDSMFRDAARIERAVRIATLPLRYSAEEIAAGEKDPAFNPELIEAKDLPPPPEAADKVPQSPLHVSREQILGSVHRVAITALDTADFSPPEEVRKQYLDLVRTELAPLGWEVVAAPTAHDQLLAELQRIGGLFDPLTGKFNDVRASEMRKSVFAGLGMTPPPDAILWLGLKQVIAQHSWGDVEWDGVSQSAITLGPVKKKFFGGTGVPQSGEGSVKAVSLTAQMRDANDQLLYESGGGIQLLEQLRGENLAALAPAELFIDATREQPAVHAALRDLVLTAEQLEAELNPRAKPK